MTRSSPAERLASDRGKDREHKRGHAGEPVVLVGIGERAIERHYALSWRRWSQPVISAPFADSAHCANTYGIGTPSTYNIDGHIQVFYLVANPRVSATSSTAAFVVASDPTHWDIAYSEYRSVAGVTTPIKRYQGATHEVTTGFVDRGRFPVDEGSYGLVFEGPQGGLTTALYSSRRS